MADKNLKIPSDLASLVSNLPYPITAVIPSVKINKKDMDETIAGMVKRSDPNTINVNSVKEFASQLDQTVMHEFEHVLQNNVSNRYHKSYDTIVAEEGQKLGIHPVHIVGSLMHAAQSRDLWDHLHRDLGLTPSEYLGHMNKGEYSLREQWADLSAIEQQHGIDLTKDPVVRKEMFQNDEKLMQLYRGTTGLRTNRLDAKDLPPMTAIDPSQSMQDMDTSGLQQSINNLLSIFGIGK